MVSSRGNEWWDTWFLGMARYVSTASKDPSTKVGAVVVAPDRRVVSVGFNGFARGCDDSPALYADRETKYRRVVHAERNALLFAGRPVCGCTVYTTPFPPCAPCAALLVQAGVARVVAPPPSADLLGRWGDDLREAERMFREAGVQFDTVQGDAA
jgi:dCMP deaminase